jgi:excisionase family DNA binding protein
MNLADAIRRAALTNGETLGQPEANSSGEKAIAAEPKPAAKTEGQPTLAKEQEMKQPQEAHDTEVPTGHNVVRLELVLNPEQLKGFFGAVIASQHSVLTLREAASYLRVSQSSLERMADEGDVPGMMVDGKWRFTRPALEDWLYSHPKKKEA